jgi:succinate-acetate transporter protein
MATEAVPQDQANELRVELPQQRPPAPTELVVVSRPAADSIADPGPLGLAAFALTTFILSLFNAGMVDTPGLTHIVLPMALVYGGVIQILAGMWEFKKNNTFGALVFSSYGAFWVGLAVMEWLVLEEVPKADVLTAKGIYLIAWTIPTVYMLIASFRTSKVLAGVFCVLMVTFLLLIFGKFNPDITWLTEWGGYLGIVTAFGAWYASASGLLNGMYGRTVAPMFPFKK